MSDFDKPIIIIDGVPRQVQGIISAEKPQQCDDCGDIKELRPYGPGGSVVCFDCGMKDEAEAERQAFKHMGY
jgi:hypothetical protein